MEPEGSDANPYLSPFQHPVWLNLGKIDNDNVVCLTFHASVFLWTGSSLFFLTLHITGWDDRMLELQGIVVQFVIHIKCLVGYFEEMSTLFPTGLEPT